MAERRHAARAHHEVQAGREQRGDQDVDGEDQRRSRRSQAAARRARRSPAIAAGPEPPARRTQRRARRGSPLCAGSPRASPSRPCGRTTSTIAITTNSATSVSFGNANVDAAEFDVAERDAQRLDHADQQRGEERARDRAQAADHDDDERIARSRRGPCRGCAGSRGSCSAPPSPARNAPEREHAGEQPRLVDAERADQRAVLGRRADQRAEARARQQRATARRAPPGRRRSGTGRTRGTRCRGSRPTPRRPGARGPSRSSAPQSAEREVLMTSTSAKVASSCRSSGAS